MADKQHGQLAPARLGDVSQAQQERVFQTDFRLRFLGTVGRQDLTNRFGIDEAAATRDVIHYKELAAGNLKYHTKAKLYTRAGFFHKLFKYSSHQRMALAHGFSNDFAAFHKPHVACEAPAPEPDTLSVLMRAIHERKDSDRPELYGVGNLIPCDHTGENE